MNNKNQSWKEAIKEALKDESDVMHYVEISEKIAHRKLKQDLGAIPNQTVLQTLTQSIRENEGMFERARKGYYRVRKGE